WHPWRRLAGRPADDRRGRPRDRPGGGVTSLSRRPPGLIGPPTSRKLAINRLRERRPLDAGVVDRFLARFEVPIVEGARCTFLYRGEADEVFLIHRIFGLPDHLPLRRLRGT